MSTNYRRSTHRARRYRGERTIGGTLVYAGDALLDKHLFVHPVSPGGFDWGPDADDDRACQLAIALLAPTFGLEVAVDDSRRRSDKRRSVVGASDSIVKYDVASDRPAMYRDVPQQADLVSRRGHRFPEAYRSRLSTAGRGWMTARERLRMHLAQALTRADSPDVREHIRAALCEWENLPPTPLVECPVCGRVGLPERIVCHDCDAE